MWKCRGCLSLQIPPLSLLLVDREYAYDYGAQPAQWVPDSNDISLDSKRQGICELLCGHLARDVTPK